MNVKHLYMHWPEQHNKKAQQTAAREVHLKARIETEKKDIARDKKSFVGLKSVSKNGNFGSRLVAHPDNRRLDQ